MTTGTLPNRVRGHKRAARAGVHTPFYCWLAKHLDDAVFEVLEVTDSVAEAEIKWIAYFGLDNLLNMTRGGSGGAWNTGIPQSDITKKRMSAAKTGVKASQANLDACAQAYEVRKNAPVSCIECRESFIGIPRFNAHMSWTHDPTRGQKQKDGLIASWKRRGSTAQEAVYCVICSQITNGSKTCSHKCGGVLAWQTRRQSM